MKATPEQKANELVEKFKEYTVYNGDCGYDEEATAYHAQRCALLSVEDTIDVLVNLSIQESGAEHIDYGQSFYRQVKDAIIAHH